MKISLEVAEANRIYFDENAGAYDADEPCMVDERSQRIVVGHLERIVKLLRAGFPDVSPRVLDAGGGSGNIATKLVALGLIPDLVDVSQEMINLYLSKLPPEIRSQSKTTCSNLEAFLSNSAEPYHLICFSSVLHHLADYKTVLDLAAERLHRGGVIYTIHDPSLKTPFWNKVDMADYHLSSPTRFVKYLQHKWRGPLNRSQSQESLNGSEVHPEPHVMSGIDDFALRKHLEGNGLQILWHERFVSAKTLPVTLMYRLAGRACGFSFAAQKPA